MPKFSSHLWKIENQQNLVVKGVKVGKSAFTWGKSANNFISLYAGTKLLPTTANFVPIVVPLIW